LLKIKSIKWRKNEFIYFIKKFRNYTKITFYLRKKNISTRELKMKKKNIFFFYVVLNKVFKKLLAKFRNKKSKLKLSIIYQTINKKLKINAF